MNEILSELSKEDLTNLENKVETASAEYNKIFAKNAIIKENKKEFTEHLMNAFTNQYKERFDERSQKLMKGLFNKILSSRLNPDTENADKQLIAGYIRKRVEELVMLIYAYRYLKYNDITKIFENYGIKLEFEPIENIVSYFAGTNFKETMKDFIERSVSVKTENEKIELNIKQDIYEQIPVALKYNKSSNPTGITKGIFKKFSLLNLLKKVNPFKAQKKCQDMTNESRIKAKADTIANSIADTIVSTDEVKTESKTNDNISNSL